MSGKATGGSEGGGPVRGCDMIGRGRSCGRRACRRCRWAALFFRVAATPARWARWSDRLERLRLAAARGEGASE